MLHFPEGFSCGSFHNLVIFYSSDKFYEMVARPGTDI